MSHSISWAQASSNTSSFKQRRARTRAYRALQAVACIVFVVGALSVVGYLDIQDELDRAYMHCINKGHAALRDANSVTCAVK